MLEPMECAFQINPRTEKLEPPITMRQKNVYHRQCASVRHASIHIASPPRMNDVMFVRLEFTQESCTRTFSACNSRHSLNPSKNRIQGLSNDGETGRRVHTYYPPCIFHWCPCNYECCSALTILDCYLVICRPDRMHMPLPNQKSAWQAVLTVLVLHTLDDIVTRHLWHPVVLSFLSHLPQGYLDDDLYQQMAQPTRPAIVDLPLSRLADLVIQVFAYRKQFFLERILPTKPTAAPRSHDEKQIRGEEEMETAIMQKLIAEGRVKPVGVNWRNVLLRWLLDDTLGTLCFAVIAFLLYSATHLYPPARVVEELPAAVVSQVASYWFSLDPVFSLIGHAYVPCHLRTQFWAAMALGLNLVMSVFLRPLVPWFMSLSWVQNFFEESAEQARLNQWWESEMLRLDAKTAQAKEQVRELFNSWETTESEEL